MKRLTALLLLFVLPALLFAQRKLPAQPKPVVFTHVTVIDATGAPAKPDMTIVITGDRITAIGKTGKVSVPNDAQVVDATGKFLIPGLWDMHAHGLEVVFPLLIAKAKFLGLLDSLGTVEKRKLADLVLLEANPLEDIHNTQKIIAVVVNGRLIPRSELQAMLARVEAEAKKN